MKPVHFNLTIFYIDKEPYHNNDIYTPVNMLRTKMDKKILFKCSEAVIDHVNTKSDTELNIDIFPALLWVLNGKHFGFKTNH